MRIAVAILAMYFVARGQDWGKTWEIFRGLNLGILALAIVLLFFNQTLVATRWYLLLRLQTIDIGLLSAIKLTFVGFFYNNFLPSSVGGDVLRAWYVTKHTPKRLEAVLSVFIDRLIGLIGIFLSALLAYMLFSKADSQQALTFSAKTNWSEYLTQYQWLIMTAVAVVAAIFVIAVLLPKTRQLLMLGCVYAMTTGRHLLVKVSKSAFLYCCRPIWMLVFLAMTLFCQTLFIFGLFLVGQELGITVGFAYYLICIPFSWVVGMLPISIGGVGVMEGGLVFLFVHLAGISSEKAFALALCQRFALLAVSLPGMFIHIAGAHVPEEFSIDSEAGIN